MKKRWTPCLKNKTDRMSIFVFFGRKLKGIKEKVIEKEIKKDSTKGLKVVHITTYN